MRCEVRSAEATGIVVDGHAQTPGWSGVYFVGGSVVVEATGADGARPRGWLVDGDEVAGPRLELVVTGPHRIEPVF